MENHPMEKQTLLSTDNLPSTNNQNTNKQSSSSIFLSMKIISVF